MKQKIGLAVAGAVVGAVVTFLLLTWAQYRGCSIDCKISPLPSLQLDCAGAPHQVAVNLGNRPPRLSLKHALRRVAELTQRRGPARVFIDDSVLQLQVAEAEVDPPAGAQPSLTVVQQLLAQARISDSVGICLVPQGGYRVQALK